MKNGILLDETMLGYDFGDNHVMSTQRIFPAYHLMQEKFLTQNADKFDTISAEDYNRDYLFQAHDPEYVARLEELSKIGKGQDSKYGLGTSDCPVWEGMSEVSEFVVSSSLTMTDNIYEGNLNFGFVLLGGLHHASRSQASGFCYYNDINVAIYRLKDLNPDISILYIDTDLHHGDGVQDEFYNDPNVLTISLHESGDYLFPGTGFPDEVGSGDAKGMSVNLPFMPYSWDKEYQDNFDIIFPTLFESFNPDYIIWQAGSDAHLRDPLGHLMLTGKTYRHLGSTIRNLALEVMDDPKVLTLGGGGYNPFANAKSWSNAFAGLTGFDLPKLASEEWVELCANNGIEVKLELEEETSTPITKDTRQITEGNALYMQQLQSNLSDYFTF